MNAYMYVGGDPVNASDPTGHMPFYKKIFSRNTIARSPSTSSLAPLIHSDSPTTGRRTGPLPSVPEQTALYNAGATLDPITGENIYEPLPIGRRNWTPPSATVVPADMMTLASASNQSLPPLINRSVKPKLATSNSLNHQGEVNSDLNPSTRPLPPLPPAFGVDSNGLEWIDMGVYKPDKATLDQYNSLIRKQT
ncbi:hypothetical protein D3C76_1225580 [compost metagenome]